MPLSPLSSVATSSQQARTAAPTSPHFASVAYSDNRLKLNALNGQDTFEKTTVPNFGKANGSHEKTAPLMMYERLVVRRMNGLEDVLRDTRDWDLYMDGSQPFLRTLRSRYEHIPSDMRKSVVAPHTMSFNIRNRVQRGKESGIIFKEEELSDILFFLYEANRRAEQGDKRFSHYPRLDVNLPEGLRSRLDVMVATKPMPAEQQFYDELGEFLDTLDVTAKNKSQINDLFLGSDVVDEKVLGKIASLANMPDLNEKDLYEYNYLKMAMRDGLWPEFPGQVNYDYRKLITKPFERLLAAEYFAPQTRFESAVIKFQNALWGWLIAPVNQIEPPSKN